MNQALNGFGLSNPASRTASRTARKITGRLLFPQGGEAAKPAVLTTASQLASKTAFLIAIGWHRPR